MSVPDLFLVAVQELRYVLRGLRRTPAFTITMVAAIALGIGLSTAVFSVVDRVLFRSLPYADDARLVSVGVTAPIEQHEFMLGRQYYDWKDHQTPFEQLTSWSGLSDCDITEESPVRLVCARVESNFLSTFGVKPMIGRDFTHDEDRPEGPTVALISYALWQSRFASNPGVTGHTISLNGKPVLIIGVLPRDFALPSLQQADLILPQKLDEAAQRRSTTGAVLSVFARLKPGVTKAQAAAQLEPLLKDFLKFVPPQFRNEVKLKIRSVREREYQDAITASRLLFWAVLAVVLIGCANVANLLLARTAARRRELAVRTALGAGRGRLAGLALLESLTIGAVGGAAGCGLAWCLLRVFTSMAPQSMPFLQQTTLNPRALIFAGFVSLAAAVIFGMAPALQKARLEILTGWHAAGNRGSHLRQSLIIGQIALSLVLLSQAGLLMQSLWNIKNDPLGISTSGVVTAEIALNQNIYHDSTQQLAFFEQLESRLRSMPGTKAVAIADSLPPNRPARSTIYAGIEVEGRPKFLAGTGGPVVWRTVTPDYFSALRIPILRGRAFSEQDRSPDTKVIILGHSLAQRLFPNGDALGKRVEVNNAPPWFTVIGIAGDVRNEGILGQDEPEYYLVRQHAPDLGLGSRMPPGSLRYGAIILRAAGSLPLAAKWLVADIHSIDPTLPIDVKTMDDRVGELAARPRFDAALMSLFAAASLLLAAIGLYGVVSFLVIQRTREIGVRMALGAQRHHIASLVLGQVSRWSLIGVIAGAAGSLASGRAVGALLFHVPKGDPWPLTAAIVLLLGTALAAAWIPSRRAARVDPLLALRSE